MSRQPDARAHLAVPLRAVLVSVAPMALSHRDVRV